MKRLRDIVEAFKEIEHPRAHSGQFVTKAALDHIKRHVTEKYYQRVEDAVNQLHHGAAQGEIPNSVYNDAKFTVNRAIDNTVDEFKKKNDFWGRGNTGLWKIVSGAHDVASGHKEVLKGIKDNTEHSRNFKYKEYAELLGDLVPLADLVKHAKTLAVKRGPAKGPKTVPSDSNEGTCQICARIIKAKKGIIAHHGYERPGQGWQTQSCMGARYQPYEVSRDRIPDAIKSIQNYLKDQEEHLANWKSTPPKQIKVTKPGRHGFGINRADVTKVYDKPANFNKNNRPAYWNVDGQEYEKNYFGEISNTESNIRNTKPELTRLQDRYKNWKKTV